MCTITPEKTRVVYDSHDCFVDAFVQQYSPLDDLRRGTCSFFAMNTIARGGPELVPGMLKEFGYAGLGGAAGDDRMAKALAAEGLKFFNGYHTMSFVAEHPALDDQFR